MGTTTALERARRILRGVEQLPAESGELRVMVKELAAGQSFDVAARLLALARTRTWSDPVFQAWLAQQHAVSVYKNPRVPVLARLREAREIMAGAFDLASAADQETLGIAASIHKRQFESTASRAELDLALEYYRRGYEQGPERDDGYTGINCAYLLDHAASLDRQIGPGARARAARLTEEASRIRAALVELLGPRARALGESRDPRHWWMLVTLGEAYFGLGRYEEAGAVFERAASLEGVPSWQRESSVRQLVELWRLQDRGDGTAADLEQTHAGPALRRLMGGDPRGASSALTGRVGLALSGGGFRASLWHVGVLAKLAEEDVLRHVEVISCVSGGSILGAVYYLELRSLLERKADAEIGRQDFIDIVENMRCSLMDAVRVNVRTQIFSDPWSNMRMFLDPRYSRTERAAQLYEETLFSRVRGGVRRAEGAAGPIGLDELLIYPKDEPASFSPLFDNWRRRVKVPALILNATTLNTGHTWQFLPSMMGEPLSFIEKEFDSNFVLRQVKFEEAPPAYRHFPLSRAVAASACVPGIFEPIVLPDLFEGKDVRLVDGAANDNQGISGLLERDCTALFLSDGAGQTASLDNPDGGVLAPILRSNGIQGEKLRVVALRDLGMRVQAKLLRGMMYAHMKKDMQRGLVDWAGCQDPSAEVPEGRPDAPTAYGIPRDVQSRLADIRTDLDSFGEVEALGLMTSGYRVAGSEPFLREFRERLQGPGSPAPEPARWKFLEIEELWKPGVPGRERLLEVLDAGSQLLFRAWRLEPGLRRRTQVIAILSLVFLAAAGLLLPATDLLELADLAGALLALVAISLVGSMLSRRSPADLVRFVLVSAGMTLVARLHLHLLDPIYLRATSLSRLRSDGDAVGHE